jgi:hypothetical protein
MREEWEGGTAGTWLADAMQVERAAQWAKVKQAEERREAIYAQFEKKYCAKCANRKEQ